jgi:hypothetical protein
MSQKLGGGFERRSLKLFKRRAGKLFVCRVKPKAIDPGVVFSTRVSSIVEVLKGKSGIMLHDLVETICPSAPAVEPVEGEVTAAKAPTPPTEEQISVIKDIRWLANEGYVIEYSDGMVFLGVQGEVQPTKAPKVGSKAEPLETLEAKTEEPNTPTDPEETTETLEASETDTSSQEGEADPSLIADDAILESGQKVEVPAESAETKADELESGI